MQDKQGEHNMSDVEINDFTGANTSRGMREMTCNLLSKNVENGTIVPKTP